MIVITPYTLDCQEVTSVNILTSAQTIETAAIELKKPVLIASKYWILCGDGDERYLITDEKSPAITCSGSDDGAKNSCNEVGDQKASNFCFTGKSKQLSFF